MLNQARLKVLKVREDHVRYVLDEARKRLGEVTKDTAKYTEIIKTLILQALYQMFEHPVLVRCRDQDKSLVESVLPEITEAYKGQSGKDITIKVDQDKSLPAETCGGVELYALKGKIKINNTLESRLELIAQQLVPQIRVALFGRNPNRKFTD